MNYSIERAPLHKNFWLPSRDQLLSVKVGQNVKLIFRVGEEVERMWIIVTKQQHDSEWTGIIDNDAVGKTLSQVLPYRTEITFHPLDIIQVDRPTFLGRIREYLAKKKGRTLETYLKTTR